MGQIEQWRYTSWRSREPSHNVGRYGISRRSRDEIRRGALGVRAFKSSASRKESSEHFK